MFSEYRIRSEESRLGLATVMESGLSLGGLTLSLSFGFLAGGSMSVGPKDGEGVGCDLVETGVGVRTSLEPEVIPRSVAALYFLSLALDMCLPK